MFKWIESWFTAREFRKLKGACFGNREKAERLVKFEQNKKTWLPRRVAIKMAFDRLEKDRYTFFLYQQHRYYLPTEFHAPIRPRSHFFRESTMLS